MVPTGYLADHTSVAAQPPPACPQSHSIALFTLHQVLQVIIASLSFIHYISPFKAFNPPTHISITLLFPQRYAKYSWPLPCLRWRASTASIATPARNARGPAVKRGILMRHAPESPILSHSPIYRDYRILEHRQ